MRYKGRQALVGFFCLGLVVWTNGLWALVGLDKAGALDLGHDDTK